MKDYLIAYGATALAFLAIDAVWLSNMANVIYRPIMGDMMLSGFRLAPAIVFYVIFVFGLVFFAVKPGLIAGNASVTLVNGALLGFIAYATYDLTNQATLKNWSWALTIADMIWGTVLSAASAYIGYWVTSRISG
ncbi:MULTISPECIES: DUF2177 family protein [Brucella/Ochrobactrum group]|uniref:DUF2177 family protein n=1 Tax=Brucella/Ochrobactrum group TaxID=2826938 RepID=UPI001655A562|nr:MULTISPECIES: DUF2177 family protein [Brucella/Ochrobactrum group]MBC8718577.1 DUF2177 family protein [Ochrobactrum sp. Marseille-Q0166]